MTISNANPFYYVAMAEQYVDDVLSGKQIACRLVKLACQRHRDNLAQQGTEGFPFTYNHARAERACKFKSRMPHVKGKWSRKAERFALQPFQAFITCSVFGWVDADGKRRFREVYDCRPRKNGKSFDAAATGLYMLVADNEPGAEVYSGATTEKQAWEVFGPARTMAIKTPELVERYGLEIGAASLMIPDDGSKFEPVIGSPGDGSSPSCAIIDEFHEHKTPALYDTMITGMGAREQPLALIITTRGVNMAGPCYNLDQHARDVLEGRAKNERLFAIIFTIDEDDDWRTLEAARKANPNYNISISQEFIEMQFASAMQSAFKQNRYKTKHLNMWCGASSAWMRYDLWKACPKPADLSAMRGRECFAGLDLGNTDDPSALALLFPPTKDDPLWSAYVKFYLPEDAISNSDNAADWQTWAKEGYVTVTEGNIADHAAIENDVYGIIELYGLKECGFDPWQATYLASRMLSNGAQMVEIPQNPQHLSPAMKQVERLVYAGQLAHNNPVLDWMIGHVGAKEDSRGNITPIKQTKADKIDGVVALIMAVQRAFASEQHTGTLEGWLKGS